ncbi:hypothetical protein KJ909_00245 [Patescibacteria group bacterium]|nr:hypothetical protein [Patescibacteria group bacterium]
MVKKQKDNYLFPIILLSIFFTLILFLISFYFQNESLKQRQEYSSQIPSFLISPTPPPPPSSFL